MSCFFHKMIEDGVAIVLILFLLWQPQWLTPFRNPTGRLILLFIVVCIAQQNLLVGCFAGLLLVRVVGNAALPSTPFVPKLDLMRIGNLMRPKDSAESPSAWLTEVPRATASYEF